MKMPFVTACAGGVCLIVAGTASAAGGTISGLGTDFAIESGPMPGLFSGAASHAFTDNQMDGVHHSLHAAGIQTDSLVTFLLVESGDGLAFVTLVDDNTRPLNQNLSSMSFTSTANGTADYWVNDFGYDILDVTETGDSLVAEGDFTWNDGAGDAFAWSNIEDGDDITFDFGLFSGNALYQTAPFQFLTVVEGAWASVKRDGYSEDSFNFQFSMPAPGALALIGIAGLTGSRRRRA